VLLLSTPHGVTASRDFVFFANSEAEGYADIGRDLHDPSVTPYRVPLHLHVECQLVATLVQQLTASGVTNLSTLSAFADAEPFPLRWGEVIPLALIQRSLDLNRTSVLLLSHPSRRRTDSVSMIPELRALGGALFKTLDVSHPTVEPNGPHPPGVRPLWLLPGGGPIRRCVRAMGADPGFALAHGGGCAVRRSCVVVRLHGARDAGA